MSRAFLIGLLAMTGCGQAGRNRTYADESAAVRTIQLLHTAETQYHDQFGRYATLPEMGPSAADLIPRDVASGEKRGYRFVVRADGSGYKVDALPLVYGETGRRAFYSDQSLIIRENRGPGPATVSSPELK